jgi:formylglycine-generating enzyme required for sulfatase activity
VLVEIEQSDHTEQLVSRALDPGSQIEAAYAAWIRLSRLPESSWPAEYEDLEEDRRFRNRLEEQFEIIKRRDEARGSYLLQTLTSTSLKHEMEFIERNSSEDKVLGKLVEFAADVNCVDSLSQCQRIEELASEVADFVAGEDWPDMFLRELFFTESEVHNSDGPVTIDTFGQWLTDVNNYKKLELDPREDSRYSWDMTISKIEKEIKDELGRKPEGDYREKLLSLKSSFDSVTQRIEGTRRLPLIEKYREDIFNCEDHWKELQEIEKKLKPVYCKRLDRLDDGQVVFAQNVGLSKSFDPLEERDGKFELLKIGGWDQLRNDGPVKTAFFYKTEGDDQENIGWPTYIRSKERELGVILRFVPAGSGQPGPFYIATREITNAQYVTFLRENGAKPDVSKTKFLDKDNKELLSSTFLDHPPCAIKWRTSTNDFVVSAANVPVTYVTYYGAQAFAAWFSAELPTASQHEYACRAGTSTKYPWGNEMSGSADYAHIRAKKWQEAAAKYNSKVNDPLALEVPPAPEGAVKDALPDGMIDTTKVAHEENIHASAWPIAGATNPNDWGIYDMIGNVWEWCKTDESDTQPIICGGSCLSPPESARPDSIHKFSTRANDVGFRVIIPAE